MTGSRRRWLVITSSFPRHERDLAGHFVRGWCRALARDDHQLDVLCWRGPNAVDRRVCPTVKIRFVPYGLPGAERLFFGAGAPENLDENPLRGLLAIPAFAAMFRAATAACAHHSYDGIIGHWLVPGGLIARAVAAVRGLNSAVVGHSGGVHLLERLPRVVARPLTRWLTAGPTTVPTEPLRDKLADVAGSKPARTAEVAPMGYEPCESAGTTTGARRAQPGLRVGFLGRLVPIKGLPRVFEAVRRLNRGGKQLQLEVVGDGPCRRRWESMAGEDVEFLGARYGSEKWELLRSWDALVVPSRRREDGRHEGLPVSLLEAASVGTVPLVSGVPGGKPWLAHPQHQIVDGTPQRWVEALRWLQRLTVNQRAELRQQTRRRVEQLAWPEYRRWWSRWLEGKSRQPDRWRSPDSSRRLLR